MKRDRLQKKNLNLPASGVIEKVKDRLSKYPNINYEEKERSLRVVAYSENGFGVEILDKDSSGEYTVFGHIWHEHLSDENEAINCFMSCLTKRVRLKVIARGTSDVGASIEIFHDGLWSDGSSIGLFNLNFFQKKHVRYLQNDWITPIH